MKKPYMFQGDAVAVFMERNGLLADECGLGKTITSIETVRARWANAKEDVDRGPVLIVCSKSAKQQWLEEICGQYDIPQPRDLPGEPRFIDSIVGTSETAERPGIIVLGDAGAMPEGIQLKYWFHPNRVNSFVIVHYQGLVRQQHILSQFYWAGVICDEAHRIKNRKAKQTRAVWFVSARWKLGLSGSLMHKNPADLWSPLHWLYPDIFRSYWNFYEHYVDYRVNPYIGVKEILGPKNLEDLGKSIGAFYLRRTKHEVAPDLPPKIEQSIHIDMTPHQAALYETVRKTKQTLQAVLPLDEARNLEEAGGYAPQAHEGRHRILIIANTLARMIRLQQVLADPSMAPFNVNCPSGKLDWVREYLEDNPDVPMLVFSKFREPVIKLAMEFKGALLVGQMKEYEYSVDAFKSGRCRLLFGTIASLGESLNLGRASRAIFIDQDHSTIKMTQAFDRFHRIDIDEPKHVIKLITHHTVDTLVEQSLQEGWSTWELVNRALKQWEEA